MKRNHPIYLRAGVKTANAIRMDESFVYSLSGTPYRRLMPRDQQHVQERRLPFLRWSSAKGKRYFYFQGPGEGRTSLPDINDLAFDHAYLAQLARMEGSPAPEYIHPSRSLIYFVGGAIGGIKVGLSNNIDKRLATLNAHSPIPLAVLAALPGGRDEERAYHVRFAAYRSHGEWFHRGPDLMDEIERLNPALSGLLRWNGA